MKTLSNRLIANQWKKGLPAKNHNKSFFTDGKTLFSYDLIIGITSNANYKIAYNYTKDSENFISKTTSQHVSHAKNSADYFLHPEDSIVF